MKQQDTLARFCKMCGRGLEGSERMTGTCVRCKTVGDSKSALDVQEAFARALAQYLLKRRSLVANRLGTWAAIVTIAGGLLGLVLAFATREIVPALGWTVTLYAPAAAVAMAMGLVGLFERGTDRTLSLLSMVVNAAALAVFADRLGGVIAALPPDVEGLARVQEVIIGLLK